MSEVSELQLQWAGDAAGQCSASFRKLLGVALHACKLWCPILDIHDSGAIEDVTGWFESRRHLPMLKSEGCGEGEEHLPPLISQGRVADGTEDLGW